MLAVKICKSLKILAQLLRAVGSPSEELSHCKGFFGCALSPFPQLIHIGKCVCSSQTQVLFLLL